MFGLRAAGAHSGLGPDKVPGAWGEPILEAWPDVPEEDWDDDIEVMEVEEPQEQQGEIME